jgi:serine/threonine-protein kinase RsbT
MVVEKDDLLPLRASEDIVKVRQEVRTRAVKIGLNLVDQTKIVTAASEIARNTVEHGNGGTLRLQILRDGERHGVRLIFEDHGPGIPDVALAMSDRFSTGSGLGLGLGGAKRLSNEFEIESQVGVGTTVTLARWR